MAWRAVIICQAAKNERAVGAGLPAILGGQLTLRCSEKATYRHSREVGSPVDWQILGARLRGHDGFP